MPLQVAAGLAALLLELALLAHLVSLDESAELAGVLARRGFPSVPQGRHNDFRLEGRQGTELPWPVLSAGRSKAGYGFCRPRFFAAFCGGGQAAPEPLAGHGAVLGAPATGGGALERDN